MTFDSLINIKMPEAEIFDRFAEILYQNFHKFQDVFVILELGEADGEISFVKKNRLYKINCPKDTAVRHQFMFHDEYKKAYLITKFVRDSYCTTLFGHFMIKMGDVFITGVEDVRTSASPIRPENDSAKKKWKLWERELAPRAFAEIAEELKKKNT